MWRPLLYLVLRRQDSSRINSMPRGPWQFMLVIDVGCSSCSTSPWQRGVPPHRRNTTCFLLIKQFCIILAKLSSSVSSSCNRSTLFRPLVLLLLRDIKHVVLRGRAWDAVILTAYCYSTGSRTCQIWNFTISEDRIVLEMSPFTFNRVQVGDASPSVVCGYSAPPTCSCMYTIIQQSRGEGDYHFMNPFDK